MTEWLAVIVITTLAVISPGPDFAMVSRNSLVLSRRAGLLTALGIDLGVAVHVAYTLLGLGLVIRQSMILFSALKLAGAAYLVWLGLRMLAARPRARAPEAGAAPSAAAALRTGFLTNALNPKTSVFVVSLFMQVVRPETPPGVQLAYGAFLMAAHALWFALVALLFSQPGLRRILLAAGGWIDRAFGAVLIGFGAALAAASLER
ncbi:Lysine exporter protein (LYSE/YGGA) [Methylobacterium sp. 4-46]|uniref:LysE family translocator n=1 Tax=unclassified Methylobacterium TaxID=2615210 RepID=UPI000152D199|nr:MULTISPECIES: LysE family transporter [Methylobacterium]ACA19670.1 Lysine exporter protein (LYSE/YGGA) [Methylobacterium sp. 4-46]WFT78867.1 LysE family transporter [Methylobacterium nodulans]